MKSIESVLRRTPGAMGMGTVKAPKPTRRGGWEDDGGGVELLARGVFVLPGTDNRVLPTVECLSEQSAFAEHSPERRFRSHRHGLRVCLLEGEGLWTPPSQQPFRSGREGCLRGRCAPGVLATARM